MQSCLTCEDAFPEATATQQHPHSLHLEPHDHPATKTPDDAVAEPAGDVERSVYAVTLAFGGAMVAYTAWLVWANGLCCAS